MLPTLGLHLRGSALPYWCGVAEAKALGIFPGKGSKTVHVLSPQVHLQLAQLPQFGWGDLFQLQAPRAGMPPHRAATSSDKTNAWSQARTALAPARQDHGP